MRYTWDVDKAERNLRNHEIAFEDAVKIFDGPTLELFDDRFDYPEMRWYAIGLADGRRPTAVPSPSSTRTDTRRIISAWKAEKHEQKADFDELQKED